MLQKGRPLLPGDTIGIVAPAGPVPDEALQEGVERLQSWGYRVRVGDFVRSKRGYLAGTDAERAADFERIWMDPAVAGVICARGGYGTMRLLHRINWPALRAAPKFFCGFSDITAFHVVLQRYAGLVTFHGPMAAAFGDEAYNAAGLLRALQERAPLGEIGWPQTGADLPRPLTIVGGMARGRLVGGNLSLLAGLMGTPYEPDFTGAIVMLEDVEEAPYRIDRMLQQLLLGGKLQRAKGLIFGDSPTCVNGADGKPSLSLFQVIEDLLVPPGIPILYGFPCGHTRYQATLPFGVQAQLDASAGSLTVLEAALA